MTATFANCLRRHGRWLIVLFALICGFATHASFQTTGVRATDDNLVFYLAGLKVFHGPALDRLNDRAIRHYTERGADEHAMMRLKLHKVSLNEYALPGAVMYATSRILKPLFDPAPDLYFMFMAQSIVFGFFMTFLVTAILFAAVFIRLRTPILLWAMGLTVGLYGVSELLPVTVNSFATILMHNSLGGIFSHIAELLLRPGPQFSPLGFTPRSHFTLLLLALFALRWRRHHAAAYGALFVLTFFHLSASGLLLVMLLGIDVLVRPEIFRRRAVAATAGLTTAVFLFRENMWEFLLGRGLGALIAVGLAVVALAALAMVPVVRARLFGANSLYARLQAVLRRRGAVGSDLILIVTAWLVTVVAIYFLIQSMNLRAFGPWSEAFYFWGRVNGRIMTLLMPSVVFGCLILILARLARRHALALRRRGHVAVPVLVALMAGAMVFHGEAAAARQKVLPIVALGFYKVEQALRAPALPQLEAMGFSETILYYGFSKSVDGHPRQLDAVLP